MGGGKQEAKKGKEEGEGGEEQKGKGVHGVLQNLHLFALLQVGMVIIQLHFFQIQDLVLHQ